MIAAHHLAGGAVATAASLPFADLTSRCPAAPFRSGRDLLLSLPRVSSARLRAGVCQPTPAATNVGAFDLVAQLAEQWIANPQAAGSSPARVSIIASVAERLSHLTVDQAPKRASQVRVLPDAPSSSGAGVSSAPLLNRQTHVAAALSGMPCGLAESVRRAPSGGAGSGATRDTGRGDLLIRRDDEAELSCMEPGGPGVVVAPAFSHPWRCSSSKRERRHLPLIPCQKPRRTTPGGTGGAGNPSSGDVR